MAQKVSGQLLIGLMLLSVACGSRAASVLLVPTSDLSDLSNGDIVSFDVMMDFVDAGGTLGGGFDIQFDATALGFAGWTSAGLGDAGFRRDPVVTGGLLNSGAVGDFNGIMGPALIGGVQFQVLVEMGANTTVSVSGTQGVAGPWVSAQNFLSTVSPNYNQFQVTKTGAIVELSPEPRNWPNVVVGEAVARAAQIASAGDADLIVTGISVDGTSASEFSIATAQPPPNITLVPSATASVELQCVPVTTGIKAAQLSVTSNAVNGSPATIMLNCTGVKPDIITNPADGGSLNFSDTTLGMSSATQGVSISNDDLEFGSELTVSEVTISGPDAADFSLDASAPYAIAKNGTISFNVQFSPTQTGQRTATLNILSDDQETPETQLSLSGRGLRSESVLLVDDNAPAGVATTYVANLQAIGIVPSEIDSAGDANEPAAAMLEAFDMVLWVTGASTAPTTGPSAASEVEISQYVTAGGCFVMSSPGWFTVRGATALMTEMGVTSAISDSGQSQVEGQSPFFTALGPYQINSADADQLNPTADAVTAFTGDAGSAAISRRWSSGDSLYFGFDLIDLPTFLDQQQVLDAALSLCRDRVFLDSFE